MLESANVTQEVSKVIDTKAAKKSQAEKSRYGGLHDQEKKWKLQSKTSLLIL